MTGTRICSIPLKTSVRMAGVGALESGRGHVRAHEPRGRRRRHVLRPRHRAAQHEAAAARAAQQRGQHGQQGAAQPADVAARPRAERLLPEPRGAEPGHRQRTAGLGQLERHPAAERVAGHVHATHAELVEEGRHRGGEHPRRGLSAVAELRRRAEARQVDRDHVALAREALQHRLPDHQLGAERMDQHERLAVPAADVVQHRVQFPARADAGARDGAAERKPGAASTVCTAPMRRSRKPPSQ